jgi:hypothetical protein
MLSKINPPRPRSTRGKNHCRKQICSAASDGRREKDERSLHNRRLAASEPGQVGAFKTLRDRPRRMDAEREGRSQTTWDQPSGSLAPGRRYSRRRSTSGSRACRLQACRGRGRRNPPRDGGGGMMKPAAGSGRMATQEPDDEIRKPDDDMKRPSAQQRCAARLGHMPAPSSKAAPSSCHPDL